MKVIFLDVDGVLNSFYVQWDWIIDEINGEKYYKHPGTYPEGREVFPEKIEFLKEIVDRTHAEIVLTSIWMNLKEPYKYLVDELNKRNIEIISHTLVIGMFNVRRAEGTRKWLDETQFDIDSFVSIEHVSEEEDYRKYGMSGRLVRTNLWDDDGG